MSDHLKNWREANKITVGEAASIAGVTAAMWSRWETGARRVPAERVLDLEKQTNVSRHVIRPDVFGPAMKREAAE